MSKNNFIEDVAGVLKNIEMVMNETVCQIYNRKKEKDKIK